MNESNRSKVIETLMRHRKLPCAFNDETRLLEDAGLDSLGMMEFIESVQVDCNVAFKPEDYSFEQFQTLGSIIALIEQRTSSGRQL